MPVSLFHCLIITFTLAIRCLSKLSFYKEIQLLLSRNQEFSLLVRSATTVSVSHVTTWES